MQYTSDFATPTNEISAGRDLHFSNAYCCIAGDAAVGTTFVSISVNGFLLLCCDSLLLVSNLFDLYVWKGMVALWCFEDHKDSTPRAVLQRNRDPAGCGTREYTGEDVSNPIATSVLWNGAAIAWSSMHVKLSGAWNGEFGLRRKYGRACSLRNSDFRGRSSSSSLCYSCPSTGSAAPSFSSQECTISESTHGYGISYSQWTMPSGRTQPAETIE